MLQLLNLEKHLEEISGKDARKKLNSDELFNLSSRILRESEIIQKVIPTLNVDGSMTNADDLELLAAVEDEMEALKESLLVMSKRFFTRAVTVESMAEAVAEGERDEESYQAQVREEYYYGKL